MTPTAKGLGAAAAALLVCSPLTAGTALAAPSTVDQVVGASDWVAQAYFCDGDDYAPKQSDVFGPGRTPFGSGSHEMRIGESSQRTELYRTPKYDGTKLSEVERLDYSTYTRYRGPDGETEGPQRQGAYLRLNVDNDNDGARDASLFFFPANNGGTKTGTWQNWSTAEGHWGVDGDSTPFTTLAEYADANPDATIVNNNDGQPNGGGLAVIAGCGQGGSSDGQINGIYNIDRVIVGVAGKGTTLYDLGSTGESHGQTDTTVVDPQHRQGWISQAFNDTEDLTTSQTFVKGPGETPAGLGSLRFAIGDDATRVEQFRTAEYDGRLLRDLRTLDFATYQKGAGDNAAPQQPAYLRLNVDADGNGDMDEQLYFIPANNGAIKQSSWQTWNAVDGEWNINGDTGPNDAMSLSTYLAENPDATLVNNAGGAASGGAVDFQVGAAGDNQRNGVFHLDDIVIELADEELGRTVSGTAYDLEPTHPGISVGDASAREKNSGTVNLTFPVSLDKAYDDDVVVPFHTENGTAKSGSDYAAKTGSVTIPAGQTKATVTVSVASDKAYEPTENMSLVLDQPVYGRIGDGTGVGTISDNDTLVTLGLRTATGHKIGADVDTTPTRKRLPVTLVGGVAGKTAKTLYNGELNSAGELHRVLSQTYSKGARVQVWAKVFTTDGTYSSKTVVITVK